MIKFRAICEKLTKTLVDYLLDSPCAYLQRLAQHEIELK